MRNFTLHCSVDPETGLNAAQWFARHFIQRKAKYYPHSGGYALDVTSGTFFPDARHVALADFNNDGVADRGFIDGVSWWGLGMHDFGFRLDVERIGPYTSVDQRFTLIARLPLDGMNLEPMAEYAVRFTVRGDSPSKATAPRYRPIPRNLGLRLRAGDSIVPTSAPRYYRKRGYDQECLVFEDERAVHLTLQAPGAGKGALEFCISEVPGVIEISHLEIRKGCADVLWRAFENGVVLLNGSVGSAVEFPMESLFPGQRFRRLQGKQDPAHNDGQPVGPRVTLGPLDGLFLVREHGGQ